MIEKLGEYIEDPSTPSQTESASTDSPSCWSSLKNDEYIAAYLTAFKVPSGIYEITWNSNLGCNSLVKQPFKTDELYQLPSPEIIDILEDIKSFWDRSDKYKEYNFIHKRGILLYGEPGCGKSGIIQLIAHQLIKMDGIIINIKDEEDVDRFVNFIPTFRKIEPNRPLIVILEDIDSIAGENKYSTSRLLNILDGVKQIEGVVYIATTNYPEKLQERITNRPSRFDRRYKIDLPDDIIRKEYIKNKLNDQDLTGIDIDTWVKKTNGMSLSHLKELVISVIVLGRTFDDAIKNLEGLSERPHIKGSKSVGFNK